MRTPIEWRLTFIFLFSLLKLFPPFDMLQLASYRICLDVQKIRKILPEHRVVTIARIAEDEAQPAPLHSQISQVSLSTFFVFHKFELHGRFRSSWAGFFARFRGGPWKQAKNDSRHGLKTVVSLRLLLTFFFNCPSFQENQPSYVADRTDLINQEIETTLITSW